MVNLPHREEYLRKKRNRKLLRFGVIVLLILLIIAEASFLSHRPQFRISEIELNGGVLVTQSEVESETLDFVSGSYFWLFPKNNVLWYPHKKLDIFLKSRFRRIDTLSLKLKDFHTLQVDITERKPYAIWCSVLPVTDVLRGDNDENISGKTPKCYFIDQNSTIFAVSPEFSGDAYFKYYGLVSDSNPIGKEFISSTTKFTEIDEFVNSTKKLGLVPVYLIANDNDQFSLVLSGGGVIYFDTKIPLTKVTENLTSLLKTPELGTTTLADLPVEYIDLRYGNKLFYKLK
jgi:cell division septal protein FtsQ